MLKSDKKMGLYVSKYTKGGCWTKYVPDTKHCWHRNTGFGPTAVLHLKWSTLEIVTKAYKCFCLWIQNDHVHRVIQLNLNYCIKMTAWFYNCINWALVTFGWQWQCIVCIVCIISLLHAKAGFGTDMTKIRCSIEVSAFAQKGVGAIDHFGCVYM